MPLMLCAKTFSGGLIFVFFTGFYAATRFAKEATILLRTLLSPLFLCAVICLSQTMAGENSADKLSHHIEENEHVFEGPSRKVRFSPYGEIVFFELRKPEKYAKAFIPENTEIEENFPGQSKSKGIRLGSLREEGFLQGADTSFSYDEKNKSASFTINLAPNAEKAGGLRIKKTWTFIDEYLLKLNIEVHNPTAQDIILPSEDFGLVYGFVAEFDYWTSCAYGTNKENIEKITPENELKPFEANWNLAAYRSQFFVIAVHQENKDKLYATQKPSIKTADKQSNLVTFFLPFGHELIKPEETIKKDYSLYLGEKREETMASSEFSPLFDKYGVWFGVIERPLFILLSFFYNITGSYGLAILLLTLVVKIFLLPLNIKQVRSMAKMQQIQPEMRRIQEEFKEDRQKQSQEIMRLYQTHNVNPLAGCLPLLLQMPIFFALFYTVGGSVEMYGEKFLWLNDLARRDPTEILPILFVVSFLWSQRKMMSDPNQKMMMLMMPVLFFFMMRQLPAGVMLYIVGQSVFSAVEQVVVPRPSTAQAGSPGTAKPGKDTGKASGNESGKTESPRNNPKKNRHKKKK
jgi:YidC/Oxa1 family membrane protein insertase